MTTETKQVRASTIRWPGLIVFLAILSALVAFSWLFLDNIIKWTLESTAGRLNGAEVNIAEVEHGWMPLRLRIAGVEVTDPGQPTHNRVVIGELRADLNLGELLVNRVIIEQLDATGIRVNQPRQSPGEVYLAPTDEEVKARLAQQWESIKLNLPELDEVMAQVDLQTDTLLAEAESHLDAIKADIAAKRENVPTSDELKAYQTQVKALLDTDIKTPQQLAQVRDQLEQLKAQFRADRDAVKALKDSLQEAKTTLSADVKALREAPGQDIERIQSFFSLDAQGLENVTGLIFGEQVAQWSRYLMLAYEQVAPMLARSANAETVKPARGEGVWFSFAEADAPPEFLIRAANTEFAIANTVVAVAWQNITHQHEQLGLPTTFQARADQAQLWDSFNLSGELSVTPIGVDAKQQWQVRGARLNDLALAQRDEFQATLAATMLDSEGSLSLRDSALSGTAGVRLAALDINANGEDRWAQLLAQALGKLERLDIRADIGGTMQAPAISLASDLDRQLRDALTSTATDAAKTKLAAVQTQLQEKVDAKLAAIAPELEGVVNLEQLSENLDGSLQELLEAQVKDQLKDKLKDKLLERLGGG